MPKPMPHSNARLRRRKLIRNVALGVVAASALTAGIHFGGKALKTREINKKIEQVKPFREARPEAWKKLVKDFAPEDASVARNFQAYLQTYIPKNDVAIQWVDKRLDRMTKSLILSRLPENRLTLIAMMVGLEGSTLGKRSADEVRRKIPDLKTRADKLATTIYSDRKGKNVEKNVNDLVQVLEEMRRLERLAILLEEGAEIPMVRDLKGKLDKSIEGHTNTERRVGLSRIYNLEKEIIIYIK
ncbi:MAG: hypothetical protein Q7S21_06915 [archaeon]|nr:hypothetical protein [archaeon]